MSEGISLVYMETAMVGLHEQLLARMNEELSMCCEDYVGLSPEADVVTERYYGWDAC